MALDRGKMRAIIITKPEPIQRDSSGAAADGSHDMTDDIYAAIDLGTNNCRLLVAKINGPTFRVIDSYSRIVRLGEGLGQSQANKCVLSENAMNRTIEALAVCAEKMRKNGVTRSRSVATEACRRAANRQPFYDRVEQETTIRLETLSPAEEAQLTLDGCRQLLDAGTRRALVFDIGGGSTELIWVDCSSADTAQVIGMKSIPVGVVTLSEKYGDDAISRTDYDAIIADLDDALTDFDDQFGISEAMLEDDFQMLGTSGTVTTLGGIYLSLPRYDRSKVDGLNMRIETIQAISDRLRKMTFQERANNACIGRDRADLVIMGCAIMEAIYQRWPVLTVRAADRGIREGLLIDLIGGVG